MKDVLVVESAHVPVCQDAPPIRRNVNAAQARQIIHKRRAVVLRQLNALVHRREVAAIAKVFENQDASVTIGVDQARHPIADSCDGGDALVKRGFHVRSIPRRRDVVVSRPTDAPV